ncbi:substrate-binding domain-containing protein [Pseudomonas protegens]|uniref:substrate-binding domain-containing protein n=1 Tax=Pseudomonas protegens TaxID=380021 RepID=UPI00315960BC
MRDAVSQLPTLRLAIASGVPPSHLSTLLALQRAEEPDVTLSFFEVSDEDLVAGLQEGRYDTGLSLQGSRGPSLKSQPLWGENMAAMMPLRCPLMNQMTLTLAALRDYPLFRWQAESCALLDQRLSSLVPADDKNIQYVTSFEMMALWVAAGYGIGVAAQSRIERTRAWEITMQPLSDGPYQIVTHLLQPVGRANPVSERFERRALKVASRACAS